MNIIDIENGVNFKLKECHSQIISEVLKQLQNEHERKAYHSNCSCSFCNSLKVYVNFKRILKLAKKEPIEDDIGIIFSEDLLKKYRDIKNEEKRR